MATIEQFTENENNKAPFIAKIYRDYKVKMWRDSVTIYKN
jgi:hypothetical protein